MVHWIYANLANYAQSVHDEWEYLKNIWKYIAARFPVCMLLAPLKSSKFDEVDISNLSVSLKYFSDWPTCDRESYADAYSYLKFHACGKYLQKYASVISL